MSIQIAPSSILQAYTGIGATAGTPVASRPADRLVPARARPSHRATRLPPTSRASAALATGTATAGLRWDVRNVDRAVATLSIGPRHGQIVSR
jgi:hypothetical protein